jgi:hypothetical protein
MTVAKLAVVPQPEIDKPKSSGTPAHYLILQAIMADTGLSFAAKSAATVMLLLFQNRKTGRCNPSYDAIAERMGGSRRTAIRAAAELVKAGYLSWQGTRGGAKNTNRYVFRIPKRGEQPSETVPNCHRSKDDNSANRGQKQCQVRSETVPTLAQEPDRTKYNQILSSPVADAPSAASDKFEELWKVYPDREGPNPKKPAREKFLAKVKAGADPDEIIAAAKRLAIAEAKNVGTRFIPMASTWLFQERWKDSPPSLPSPSASVEALPIEYFIKSYKLTNRWSPQAPVSDISQVDPAILAKHGLMPDGRRC